MSFDKNFKETWDRRRADRTFRISQGKVTVEYVWARGHRDGKIHVSCPFTPEFSAGAKELSGRWKPRTLVWIFPIACRRLLLELVEKVYSREAMLLVGFPPEAL